jgi:hypothetical protein
VTHGALQLFLSHGLPRKTHRVHQSTKGDPLALAKGIIPCNILMGLAANHYIKKYM